MSRISHRIRVGSHFALPCILALTTAGISLAQTNRVVAIEEHWELQVGQPDGDLSAPQTTMVVSPDRDIEGIHFLFTLNHVSVPDYEPGGMQVQLWDGTELVESQSAGCGALSHDSEVVRWVHRVSLTDGTIKFEVLNGESETWGAFGGEELSVSGHTSMPNLNQYRPSVSLAESQVNYAENRVVSLILTKLVWETEDGEVHEINAPIPLDTDLDP